MLFIPAQKLQYNDGKAKINIPVSSIRDGIALINIFGSAEWHITHIALNAAEKFFSVGLENISGTKPTLAVWTNALIFYMP